jgi:glycosyltransferase involved in cell wall biosynthesis
VVATAVGGIPEVITDGVTGRLVPPRDPIALAAALTEALLNPDLRKGWAERARDSVVRFDIEATVERTLREYQRAVGDAIPAA